MRGNILPCRRLILPTLTLLLAMPSAAHTIQPIKGNVPADAFACQDNITIHVGLDAAVTAPATLTAEWHNRSTDLRHATSLRLGSGASQADVWMRYEPPAAGPFGRILGDRYGDYAGEWSVTFLLDGRPIGSTGFSVRC